MPCNCKNHSNAGNAARAVLPKLPTRVFQTVSRSDLPNFSNIQLANEKGLTEQDTMTAERRRIEKLRRDVVRRTLGIG